MRYQKTIQLIDWAKARGIDPSWARKMAVKGDIPGAFKEGRDWQITVEVPQSRSNSPGKIPLKAWAKTQGIDLSNARKLAREYRLLSAERRGRDWWVNEDEIIQPVKPKKASFNKSKGA